MHLARQSRDHRSQIGARQHCKQRSEVATYVPNF
jgi:hypothetical protein